MHIPLRAHKHSTCTVTALPSSAKRAREAASASLSRAADEVRCCRMPGRLMG
jgi:hypothetical protein